MDAGPKAAIVVGVSVAALGLFAFWLDKRERLAGGRASGRDPSEFNPYELARGSRVELEHTDDPAIAREIAMDHLTEDPRYYDKLLAAGL